MRPEPDRFAAFAAPRTAAMLAVAVALGTLVAFIVRDGFAAGDLLGALLIGILTFVVLTLLRRFGRR